MADLCIHIWGFYNDDGTPRQPDQAAAENRVAHNVFLAVRENLETHGGTLENLRVTRTLDGWFIGCEFDVPAHGEAARMWHRIMKSNQPWGKRPPEEIPFKCCNALVPGMHEPSCPTLTRM